MHRSILADSEGEAAVHDVSPREPAAPVEVVLCRGAQAVEQAPAGVREAHGFGPVGRWRGRLDGSEDDGGVDVVADAREQFGQVAERDPLALGVAAVAPVPDRLLGEDLRLRCAARWHSVVTPPR